MNWKFKIEIKTKHIVIKFYIFDEGKRKIEFYYPKVNYKYLVCPTGLVSSFIIVLIDPFNG